VNRRTNAAMLLGVMGALAMSSGLDIDSALGPIKKPKPSNKMPLTPEEEIGLASLSGKEKKRYVKMLKEKYKK
jgi:hypothetical protein